MTIRGNIACQGHDRGHPKQRSIIGEKPEGLESLVIPPFMGFRVWGIHFRCYFADSRLRSCEKVTFKVILVQNTRFLIVHRVTVFSVMLQASYPNFAMSVAINNVKFN